MEQPKHITARGTGVWGGERYDVELTTTMATYWDSRGERTEALNSYALRCSLRELDPPETRTPAQPFESFLGEELSSGEFVADYVQLRFNSPPLNLSVWPRIYGRSGVLVREDGRYADALVGLIGRRFVATDELLDLGLVLDFEGGTRLAVPPDGTDASRPEVAEFGGKPGGMWPAGEPPFTPSAGVA